MQHRVEPGAIRVDAPRAGARRRPADRDLGSEVAAGALREVRPPRRGAGEGLAGEHEGAFAPSGRRARRVVCAVVVFAVGVEVEVVVDAVVADLGVARVARRIEEAGDVETVDRAVAIVVDAVVAVLRGDAVAERVVCAVAVFTVDASVRVVVASIAAVDLDAGASTRGTAAAVAVCAVGEPIAVVVDAVVTDLARRCAEDVGGAVGVVTVHGAVVIVVDAVAAVFELAGAGVGHALAAVARCAGRARAGRAVEPARPPVGQGHAPVGGGAAVGVAGARRAQVASVAQAVDAAVVVVAGIAVVALLAGIEASVAAAARCRRGVFAAGRVFAAGVRGRDAGVARAGVVERDVARRCRPGVVGRGGADI